MQHPLQQEMSGEIGGLNSVDKAVFRIVEMGFSPEQAKGALKITDMGDGLRVDRAVEYLLRSMGDVF
jgi:UBA/TS-N domain